MTKISEMRVELVYWVQRYKVYRAVEHVESGRVGVVAEFEHQGFYVGDRYVVIPVYLVAFEGYCEVHDAHERCQHYVAEEELRVWQPKLELQ